MVMRTILFIIKIYNDITHNQSIQAFNLVFNLVQYTHNTNNVMKS